MPRPGCVLRAALVTFGLLFLPMSIWFAYANIRRNWPNALALLAISLIFLKWGVARDADSWMSAIDDLGDDQQKGE
jgi:hypothetical protein